MSASTQPMSVDNASFDVAAKELDAHVQDDHKLLPVFDVAAQELDAHIEDEYNEYNKERTRIPSPSPVSDPQSESDDATMSETSSQAEFSAYAQEQQQLDKQCDEQAWLEQSSHKLPPNITRPVRQPKYESSEGSESSYKPSEDSDRMYASDEDEDVEKEVRQLFSFCDQLGKQTLRDYKESVMERDMVVEQQRELIEQQQKLAAEKDAEVSSLKQGFQQLKQQVQALTSRQQATQQDVTRTANAIVSTQPTAQLEDLVTQFGSMSFGQGSQVSANVVFSAKSELGRRSSRVPEASSSLKNKVEDFTRPGSDTLKVPKV